MAKQKTFEQALSRLEEIVSALDDGGATLDESLKLFGEGAELLAFCNQKLADAKLKIEKLLPQGEQAPGENGGGADDRE